MQHTTETTNEAEKFLELLASQGGTIRLADDLEAKTIDSASLEDVFIASSGRMFVRVDNVTDFSLVETQSSCDELPIEALTRALELTSDDFEEFRTDFLVP